ncbi:hypothetical protein ACFIJ5_09605 [Haloimpatiens sp. FM7330]|uniref:hypothetical protein n=1 Tax=Haloimpatiens sp. FM7330 TaxID=3298610 RepID=UPI00362815BA
MNGKKRLLKLSEKIGELSVQEAIGLILSMIQSVEEKNQGKDELLEYIYIANNNLNNFSGFKNAQYEMHKLLNDILCISKQNEKVVIKNRDYDCLSFNEFKYVMSWARKISMNSKLKKNKKNTNSEKVVKGNNANLNVNKIDERWNALKNYKF